MSTQTTEVLEGLTSEEVAAREQQGKTNDVPEGGNRTVLDIVRANVLTRFNAIIAVLAGVVLFVGSPVDALFGGVMVLNSGIGVIQEVLSLRTLRKLRVLVVPTVTVQRDGQVITIPRAAVVLDDVVVVNAGDQVPVDGDVLFENGLEADESALTGEADHVAKDVGSRVLAGSVVVAGNGRFVATAVGEDAWIQQLVAQARVFAPTTSELRRGVDTILRVIAWALIPLGGLLLASQLRSNLSTADALVSAVAGVVGLVPQGLILMVSIAMAAAVRRLGSQQVLIQELQAVEGLARIDVLCVDKTGTLTTGKLALDELKPIGVEPGVLDEALAALAATEQSPTAPMVLLGASLGAPPSWKVTSQVAFSSARKWSATAFEGHGAWVMGAPEVLLAATPGSESGPVREQIDVLTAAGKRVLLVANTSSATVEESALPSGLEPAGLIVLREDLRSDAAETMRYFAQQHVTVKVISGDSPRTVSAVARQLEVPGAERYVDLRDHSGPLDDVVRDNTVFGRVSPEQKRELVEALQRAGHVVAMTGDGVNDIPALKKADIGIAMDTATPATKAVAQLVLLDGRFDRLPHVVAEGRRVVANMERVSLLFVTKTVYAAVFALVIGISGAAFPFLPRHLSLVSELTVGVPAFILSFRRATDPSRPGYLSRVVRFSIPAGMVTAAVTLVTYGVVRSPLMHASLDEGRTASTIALAAMSFWVLSLVMSPVDAFDRRVIAALLSVFVAVIAWGSARRFYALDLMNARDALVAAVATLLSIVVLDRLLRRPVAAQALGPGSDPGNDSRIDSGIDGAGSG